MTRLALVALLAIGCSKKQQDPPPAPKPAITEPEVKRATDACKDYIARACACPSLAEQCATAKAFPEVIELSREVATNPDGTRQDALQAADAIRKTVAQCLQEIAKLPPTGCP